MKILISLVLIVFAGLEFGFAMPKDATVIRNPEDPAIRVRFDFVDLKMFKRESSCFGSWPSCKYQGEYIPGLGAFFNFEGETRPTLTFLRNGDVSINTYRLTNASFDREDNRRRHAHEIHFSDEHPGKKLKCTFIDMSTVSRVELVYENVIANFHKVLVIYYPQSGDLGIHSSNEQSCLQGNVTETY